MSEQASPAEGTGVAAGKAVWYEIMTQDVGATETFYGELFGWVVNEQDMGGGQPYRMIRAGEKDIGGYCPTDGETPSHWLSYITVDDVDSAVDRATSAGGQAPVAPTDIPNVGRFAIIRDPSGAMFCPFRSAHPELQTDEAPNAGEFCWNELLTSDAEGSRAFYESVVGWTSQDMDMGPAGNYIMLARPDGATNAGIMQMPPEAEAPPHWLPYVMVEDVDATATRAKELGATECVAPRDIPNIGRFAVFSDPTGAPFAIYKSATPAQDA